MIQDKCYYFETYLEDKMIPGKEHIFCQRCQLQFHTEPAYKLHLSLVHKECEEKVKEQFGCKRERIEDTTSDILPNQAP